MKCEFVTISAVFFIFRSLYVALNSGRSGKGVKFRKPICVAGFAFAFQD